MKILYFLIPVLLIILLVLLRKTMSRNPAVLAKIEKLPQEYASYQDINTGVATEKYKIEPLVIKEDFKQITIAYFNPTDNTVAIKTKNYDSSPMNNPDVYLNSYYKLNTDGVVVDSLILAADEISKLYEGYLVNDDGYYTWLLDGDKTKHPCEIINRDLALSEEAIQPQFDTLYKRATLAKNHSVIYENKSYYTVLFFIDKKWVMLFGSHSLKYDSSPFNKDEPPEKHFKENTIPNLFVETEVWNNKSDYINLVHFQKKSFEKERSSGGFNPIYHFYPAKWKGEGYMQINFNGDTIPFKMPLDKFEKESDGTYQIPYKDSMLYFTAEGLEYGLITYEKERQIFLVEKK